MSEGDTAAMHYRGFQLDGFQEEAIRHLMAGRSILVTAPTGTGKSLIADWLVEDALAKGREVVYTAPIKALSNQKYRDYVALYGEEKVGLVTGDLVIRRDAPCRVMTTEILRNMLLTGEDLSKLHAVVVDEIHFLDDPERGTVWEEILIYLPAHVQIVGLSATLSNLEAFAGWLSHVRGAEVPVIEEYRRAVPLTLHLASVDTGIVDPADYERIWRKKAGRNEPVRDRRGRGRDRDRDRGRRPPPRRTHHDGVIAEAIERRLLPCLYFVFSRKDAERMARDLPRRIDEPLIDDAKQARIQQILREAAPALGPALEPELRALYEQGVAFHHAGLHVSLKALVERLYEEKLIAVLYCTSTFALGINMPARTVIFDSYKKFDGQRVAPLTTRQFMQKAGRAGRRGLDHHGHVVIRVDLEEYEELKPHLRRFQEGAYEPVHSSFNLSWNSVVNLLQRHDEAHIRSIVEKSFLNWYHSERARRSAEKAEALRAEVERGGAARHEEREVRRLERRAAESGSRCWGEFLRKVEYLQHIGYLDENRSFNAGARVLANLQIAEILTTELVLAGVFEELEGAELFGVLCGLVNDLPRAASLNANPTKSDRRLARDIGIVAESDLVRTADVLAGTETVWDPQMMPLGQAWASGRSLQEILLLVRSATDISGDLISCFRRAKDLAGQLREVYAQVPQKAEMLARLVRTVSRDEVEVVD